MSTTVVNLTPEQFKAFISIASMLGDNADFEKLLNILTNINK